MYYYRIKKLCIKLVIERSLHHDARSKKKHQVVKRKHVVYSLYYLKTENRKSRKFYEIFDTCLIILHSFCIFGSHKHSASFARDCSRDAVLHVVIMSNFNKNCILLKNLNKTHRYCMLQEMFTQAVSHLEFGVHVSLVLFNLQRANK